MSIHDPSFCIPKDIPDEFLQYDMQLEQLSIGTPGKLGILQLTLENDRFNNKTTIKNQFCKVPLCIQRPLYLEETCPDMAYVYIISPSGGVLQGDRYRTDIILKNYAKSHITTQSATRIYKMNKNFGTQIINLEVGDNCYLEYIPDQIIPFKNSRYYQVTNLKVHDNATCIYSEILTSGRVASNESFEYDIFYMKVKSINHLNKMRFIDVAKLEPKKQDITSFGIMDEYNILGNVYILSPKESLSDLKDEVNLLLTNFNCIEGGCTKLPDNTGLLVRLIGTYVFDIKNLIYSIIELVRKKILNVSFSGIRKN
ncbi:MAG TPA: urease accessory protein UreD [Candidatus Nitrosocosmicus sp.]